MNNIKKLRINQGLTQRQLAEMVNVEQTAVSKWETGVSVPSRETEIKLAEIFNVSLDQLAGRENIIISTEPDNNIKKIRESKGMKQDELARLLNVTQGAVSGWETGRYNIDNEKLKAIANILDTTTDELLGISYPNVYPVEMKKFQMLGTIAAGDPIFANEEYETYVYADSKIRADFCLKVKGDSMINARILDGDVVFIKRQPDVLNGQIAAVLIDNEVTLKRVFKRLRQVVLQAENPNYPPIVVNGYTEVEVSIIGLAVAFQSLVR